MRRGIPRGRIRGAQNRRSDRGDRRAVVKTGTNLIITRLAADKARKLKSKLPRLKYLPEPRIATVIIEPVKPIGHGAIMVISAGT